MAEEAGERERVLILRTEELSDLDPIFSEAVQKGLAGEPLRSEEAEALLLAKGAELSVLTLAADALRRRLVGEAVTYVVNRNLNFTNVCDCKCTFCGFARSHEDADAYLLGMEQIRDKVREARSLGATEICAQGGISDAVDLEYCIALLRTIHEEMPGAHVHAFSPMEIDHLSEAEHISVGETLTRLMEAGLGSMPGTAAEILADHVREVICPGKISSERWAEIIYTAHGLGLPTTSTMMYGTVETTRDRATHLLRIREIQSETQGFTEFVPLPFVHGKSPISQVLPRGPTGAEDIKAIATARLALGSALPNIQVSWVKMGRKLAQVGLICGANDLGGTLMEENISRCAGAECGTFLSPEEMRHMIRDIGRVPAQRDTLYRILG